MRDRHATPMINPVDDAQPTGEVGVRDDTGTTTPCLASRHDTMTAHKNFGCRCPAAVQADTRWDKRYRMRRLAQGGRPLMVDAVGTHRRIRALAAAGWPASVIHRALGRAHEKEIGPGQLLRGLRVTERVAGVITELYERLENEPGPSRTAATWARKQGWPGPWAWDPEVNPIDNPESCPSLASAPRDKAREYENARAVGLTHARALKDAGLPYSPERSSSAIAIG